MLSLKQLIKTGFTTAQARALVAQQPKLRPQDISFSNDAGWGAFGLARYADQVIGTTGSPVVQFDRACAYGSSDGVTSQVDNSHMHWSGGSQLAVKQSGWYKSLIEVDLVAAPSSGKVRVQTVTGGGQGGRQNAFILPGMEYVTAEELIYVNAGATLSVFLSNTTGSPITVNWATLGLVPLDPAFVA